MDPRGLFLYDLGYVTLKIKNFGIMYISFPSQSDDTLGCYLKKERNKEKSLGLCEDLYAA